MKRKKVNQHAERMAFLARRINEINEWREEAIKHAVTVKQRAAIDARVLELREAAERER
jgi:hypothetical protein